jgi:hypothetical protein
VEYKNLKPLDEREIFMRVQKGVALTSAGALSANLGQLRTDVGWACAELLRVGDTPRRDLINELCDRYVKGRGKRPVILDWNTQRARDFEGLATVAHLIVEYPERPNPTAAHLKYWLDSASEPEARLRPDLIRIMDEFWRIAKNKKLNVAFTGMKQKVAPLEFIMIGASHALRRAYSENEATLTRILPARQGC